MYHVLNNNGGEFMENLALAYFKFLKSAAGFAAPVGFMVLAFYIARYVRDRQIAEVLRGINRSLHLTLREAGFFVRPLLSGEFNGFSFSLTMEKKEGTRSICIVLHQALDLRGHISVRMESSYTKAIKHIGVEDIATGDDEFDRVIICEASDAHYITAFMNRTVRSKILRIVSTPCKINITMKGIEVRYPCTGDVEGKKVRACVADMADIMKDFTRDTGIKERLIENGTDEPDMVIRMKNLQALVLNFPVDDGTRYFLTTRLRDNSILIQVEAAKYLGEEGRSHLLSLLEEDRIQDLSLVVLIMATLPPEEVPLKALQKAYSTAGSLDVKRSLLRIVKKRNAAPLSRFFGEELLKSDGELRDIIIDVLAHGGNLDCVEALYKTGKQSLNPLVKNAVNNAIGRIQYRHGSGERGWLSVSDQEPLEGALSVDDSPGKGSGSDDDKERK